MKLKNIIVLILFIVMAIFTIRLGGYYGGKMVGAVLIIIAIGSYFVFSDLQKYKNRNNNWIQAFVTSFTKNLKAWFK